jgi:structural maintenance of chromosome 4
VQALETATEELQKLKRQLDEQRAESNNTKSLEIEMRNKFEEGRKKLKEHLSKLQGYQGRLENLKEKYQNLRYVKHVDNGGESY